MESGFINECYSYLYKVNSHGHQDLRYGYVYEDFQKLSMEAYE